MIWNIHSIKDYFLSCKIDLIHVLWVELIHFSHGKRFTTSTYFFRAEVSDALGNICIYFCKFNFMYIYCITLGVNFLFLDITRSRSLFVTCYKDSERNHMSEFLIFVCEISSVIYLEPQQDNVWTWRRSQSIDCSICFTCRMK